MLLYQVKEPVLSTCFNTEKGVGQIMNNRKIARALRIFALACIAVTSVCVLIYGFKTGFGLSDLIAHTDSTDTVSEGRYSYDLEEEVSSLREIDIDWVSGPVTLYYYDGSTVYTTETSDRELSGTERLEMEISGSKLSIDWDSSAVSLTIGRVRPKTLAVWIPRAFSEQIDSLSIGTVSGDITIDGISALNSMYKTTSGRISLRNISGDELRASTVSGDISCESISCTKAVTASTTSGSVELIEVYGDRLLLDTTSGSMSFSGTADNITCRSVSGSVDITASSWPSSAVMHSVSGNISMHMPEAESGFTCTFSSVSGDFSSAFDTVKDGKAHIFGDGSSVLEVETTSAGFELLKN